jgi:hypothetical protein
MRRRGCSKGSGDGQLQGLGADRPGGAGVQFLQQRIGTALLRRTPQA